MIGSIRRMRRGLRAHIAPRVGRHALQLLRGGAPRRLLWLADRGAVTSRNGATEGRTSGGPREVAEKVVLVVDDSEDTLFVLESFLSHSGYRVITAADGEAGVTAARENVPDLIIMDIAMPRMDGFAARAVLAGEAGTKAIPVIAFTAHAHDLGVLDRLDQEFDAFLMKPLRPLELLEVVRRFVGPGR